MQYVKINGYTYTDHPNDGTLYLGRDSNGAFIHQVIEDPETTFPMPLDKAVAQTNEDTIEFAKEQGFEISFGDIDHIMVNDINFALCQQEMSFDDGRWAVQMNAYFFDPADRVFRMTQFGTLPMTAEDHEAYGEKCCDYASRCMKRLIADMAIPSSVMSFKIPAFKV